MIEEILKPPGSVKTIEPYQSGGQLWTLQELLAAGCGNEFCIQMLCFHSTRNKM